MGFRRGGAGKRRDRAERPILDALAAVGAKTFQVSGNGLPDLIVEYRGSWAVAEVKTGKGKLTEAQQESGAGRLWPIWRTPEDALKSIGVL